jgi:hypothetical protein
VAHRRDHRGRGHRPGGAQGQARAQDVPPPLLLVPLDCPGGKVRRNLHRLGELPHSRTGQFLDI